MTKMTNVRFYITFKLKDNKYIIVFEYIRNNKSLEYKMKRLKKLLFYYTKRNIVTYDKTAIILRFTVNE
jgi:hypothetical protein